MRSPRHVPLLGAGAALSGDDATRRLYRQQTAAMDAAYADVGYQHLHQVARDAVRAYLRSMADQEADEIARLAARADALRARTSGRTRGCPDGGACHHDCGETCWRSQTCAPLSSCGDIWPSTTPVDLAATPEGPDA